MELKHYGIPGMKWGVRRYQNADGTLTPKGRKRYGKAENESDESETEPLSSSGRKSPEQKESERLKRADVKNRGTLSNDMIKQKIERLKLERELRQLTEEEISPGRRFVKGIMKDVGEKTLKTALTGAALYGIKSATAKEFDVKEFGEAMFNGGAKKK